MDYISLISLIEELNDLVFKEIGITEYQFFFSAQGDNYIIGIGDTALWCSEDDQRDWVDEGDEKEPLRDYLVTRVKEMSITLSNIHRAIK